MAEHLATCPTCQTCAAKLEAGIRAISKASTPERLPLPEKIASYEIRRRLAAGGMGVVYAGLGRKEEAIREGILGVGLFPISKDAVLGPHPVEDPAFIYTLAGEYDAALDQIEHLLSIPSWLSVPLLRLDPRWDPLRDHPRHKELVQPYELKSSTVPSKQGP
ncbi:MAG: hypothetical protein ACYTFA_08100 [Planctomycetota bacterium]